MSSYLPTREAELSQWVANFHALISASPTAYGLTAEQVADYTGLYDAFAAAYQAATTTNTRTKTTVEAKNLAKRALITLTRQLVKVIQGQPTTTDTQRVELGITVRDPHPTPVPPPATAPSIELVSVKNRTVTIRLWDADGSGRARPADATGASIFAHVGPQPPADIAGWRFMRNTSATTVSLNFNASTAAETVWLTAFWFNRRKQSGPAALPPTQANLPATSAAPTESSLKIAA